MRIISFFLIFGLLAQNAFAEVIESLDYQYYDVDVAENQSLLFALNQASRIEQDGKISHGITKWEVRWNYRWSSDKDGMCKIISSTTNIRGTILLPRLTNSTEDQWNQFDSFFSALLKHEQGHYQIGKDAAKAIDEQILSLPPSSDCRALEKAVNGIANQTLDEYKKKDKEYDSNTMHGKTQGTWLEN